MAEPATRTHQGSHQLYRLYDENDRLLYVGISHSARFRLMQHVRKVWWKDVSRKEVEKHPNRKAALQAEKTAVHTERPIWNVQGRPGLTSEEHEYRLSRLSAAVAREKASLDDTIAAARRAGHSYREIGEWANINHETARAVASRINDASALAPEESLPMKSSQKAEEESVRRGSASVALASNLPRFRKARNMSQRELSVALCTAGRPISPTAINRIERSGRRVDVDDLVALAAVLGVPPGALLEPPACTTCSGAPPAGFACTECSATTPRDAS